MHRPMRVLAVALFATSLAVPAAAQTPAGLTADLIKATNEVEQKLLGLGNALSAAQYDWRPGQGVRSVGEVLLHVAADNYFLPTAWGVAAPASTRIKPNDYPSVQAYEGQKLDKAAIIAEVTASFAHLEKAMAQVPESKMNESMKLFGQDYTMRGVLLLTTTHIHEHLGQMIAYARSNNVKPPWSR